MGFVSGSTTRSTSARTSYRFPLEKTFSALNIRNGKAALEAALSISGKQLPLTGFLNTGAGAL